MRKQSVIRSKARFRGQSRQPDWLSLAYTVTKLGCSNFQVKAKLDHIRYVRVSSGEPVLWVGR